MAAAMLQPQGASCGRTPQEGLGSGSKADERHLSCRPRPYATRWLPRRTGQCAECDLAWPHDEVADDLGTGMPNDHQVFMRDDLDLLADQLPRATGVL